MKHLRVFAIAAAAIAILLAFAVARRETHSMQLTTYMTNSQALRAGAPVRLAGVEIGFVKTVRVRPELKENPVEVVMNIDTPYELKIPKDATVVLERMSVLGESFPTIHVENTLGPPVGNHGVLKSMNVSTPSFSEVLHRALQKVPCSESGKTPDESSKVSNPK